MAKERNEVFQYEVLEGFDFIIEESGNSSVNLRKISWNGRPHKLDIRKYAYKDGQEQMMKGISLTEDGANELASVMVEQGYGDTKRIIKALRQREDFNESMLDKNAAIEDDDDEDYYDPKQLLGYDFDSYDDEEDIA